MTVSKWYSLFLWATTLSPTITSLLASDAGERSTEGMHLKKSNYSASQYSVQVLTVGNGDQSLIQEDGNKYNLTLLEPYVELFSSKHFSPSTDGRNVIDKRTGTCTPVTIFRAHYDDGSTLLVEKDAEHGKIVYAEVRRPRGEPDTLLVPDVDYSGGGVEPPTAKFVSFTPDDIDIDFLNSKFSYGKVDNPDKGKVDDQDKHEKHGGKHRLLRSTERVRKITSSSRGGYRQSRNDLSTSTWSTACSAFQVVNIAIIFDADFCVLFGGFEQARRRIMTIVASASFHYERDMCVKLSLTDIFTPENSCSAGSRSFFDNFNRVYPCGTGNASFLSLFSMWMRGNRNSLKIDEDAVVHMFSGFPPPAGTIGCAYVGSFCSHSYDYGLEYMSFSVNTYQQGVVLAHEVGHNLKASHLSSNSKNYIMEPVISNAADGFSYYTISRILSFLNSGPVTCDSTVVNAPPVPLPTSAPVSKPTDRPTSSPTFFPSFKPRMAPVTPSPTAGPNVTANDYGNPCVIYQDEAQEPLCIFTALEQAKYACFEASLLLTARATSRCLFPNPRIRILRCDGRLRTGQIPYSEASDDDFLPPEFFETGTCAATCVVVSDRICFLASTSEQVYSISYSAVADFDVAERYNTDVAVKMDDGTNTCAIATTSCNEQA